MNKAINYRNKGYEYIKKHNPILAEELQARFVYCNINYSNYSHKYVKYAYGYSIFGINPKCYSKHKFNMSFLSLALPYTPEHEKNNSFWKNLLDYKNFSSKQEQDRYIKRNLVLLFTNENLHYECWI